MQILFVSNNKILNDLYAVNLELYVGAEVKVIEDVESACEFIASAEKLKMVVTLSLMDGNDAPLKVKENIEKKNYHIPMIIVGKQSEVNSADIIILPASYNIRALIKSVAQILGVTAKAMIEKEVPDYYPVTLNLFKYIEISPCDIFYKARKSNTENEFLTIAIKGQTLEVGLKKYESEGILELYVDKMDRLIFINKVSERIVKELERDNLTNVEKIELSEQGIEIVADQLFVDRAISKEIVAISKACIQTVNEVIKETPKIKNLLSSLIANKTRYIYTHSILATFVSKHIIERISWGGDSHFDKISFVLFFNDIFLVPLYNKYPELKYEEELLFNNLLTEKEKDIVINHAKLAGQIVQDFPRCPLGADAIITQHHGVTTGEGFAINFKDDISPLAKVIIIAENFVEEMFRQSERGEAINRDEIMEILQKKYTRHTYRKIIDTLGSLKVT